ncbi:hypothetical protein HPP92_023793 [Vanilla planifolia]|uniref:AAA+ ATPase domain-containing protein n=1 Tax=Vanilla planifolia TaxID=51239 RepID=A0A835PL82_VANPL|nr:hypothetical protein HPP92_023793 [Vanilla planifolia]
MMSFEDLQKHLRTDKIKLLTSKSILGTTDFKYRDFIVDLKEIPGDKNIQKTRWATKLSATQVEEFLEEYKGAQYEIETHMRVSYFSYFIKVFGSVLCLQISRKSSSCGFSISGRIMIEFGMVTALTAAAATVVTGFMASAAFAVTSFCFFSRLYEMYTVSWVSASLEIIKPLLLVFIFMVFLMRFTLSRRSKNFNRWDFWQTIEFGQSKAHARVDGSTGVTFNDVAGIDEAVEELLRYLKNPELFDQMGIKPPHGVLLEGPPGCGKTLVAKAIAGEAGVPFYQMAGSEFVEVLVGVGSARIRDLFKRAKVNKPSVVFVDEIDALGTRRQGFLSESTNYFYDSATQERETTLNQLLIELDGFDTGKGVIFLGATNRMDLLDPALLRPGRFDRKIRIRPPGAKGRADILKVHARKVKLSPDVDLLSLAQNLPGWTGAKLAQLIQEAALVAIRKNHEFVIQSDMYEAVDRLTIGPKLLGLKLGHQGQCRRAVAEVGVAITSHLLRRYENARIEYCERISIIPRGKTLSQVVFHRLEEELCTFERRPQLLHRLQSSRRSYIWTGHVKSISELSEGCNLLGTKMLTIWNLENPMTIHGQPFPWKRKVSFVGPRLDFEGSLYSDYGLLEPPINFDLDDEAARRSEKLICDTYEKTVSLLRKHFAALLKTVKVLLDNKEIITEHIDFIIDNYPAETPVQLVLEEKDPGSLPFFEKHANHGLVLAPRVLNAAA